MKIFIEEKNQLKSIDMDSFAEELKTIKGVTGLTAQKAGEYWKWFDLEGEFDSDDTIKQFHKKFNSHEPPRLMTLEEALTEKNADPINVIKNYLIQHHGHQLIKS